MKRPSTLLLNRGDTDMDAAMTPMIDVVFLLLVFFVWTASFQIVEQILPSQMSSQVGSEPQNVEQPPPEKDFEDIVVKIGWASNAPVWQLNGNRLDSLDQLETQLAAIADVKNDATIILDPDSVVPLGHVIEAYDSAKLAGFTNVSFAVDPGKLQ